MKFDQLTEHAEGKLLSGIIDRVGHVVINNPERHNAISMAMYQAGAAEVTRMAADPEAPPSGHSRRRRQGFRLGRGHLEIREGTVQRRGCQQICRGQQGILRFGVQFPEADHRDDSGILHRWRHGSGGGL